MDLAELKFVVDTKDLEDAAKKIADLGTEVSKLNKPMQTLAKESAKTNKELSKAEEAAAKAALAQTKLEQAQTKSAQAASKSSSVLERQNLILEYMAQGNSKGQASILATAKAAGALDDEMLALNKTLVTQRTLIGGDPFDKSIGLMQKLQNEYKTTTEVTNLFNKNLGLTQKQMTDLAREKERLIALYGIEGKSLNGLSAEYDQLIQKSVMINQANDARTSSMKAQIKAQNDTAKANEYMAKELERVNRLTESGGNVTSATNNKLIKFEQALKASGATAAEQVTKLEAYRQKLLSIQKAGGNRQIDYLSRALGPQITDIAVGLATGQAPLTILLQQGGQLRDQFALAGVAGADMGKMLIQASKSMVSSVKDVGVAVGQVFVGAITGSGKAVTNFAMQITGTSALLDVFNAKLIATAGASSFVVKAFAALGAALTLTVGLAIFAVIAAFVMYIASINNVVKEENALNRALNLTGAAMGLNLDMAYDAARSMEQFGVSTGTALTVLTEMAKIGGMSSKSLEMVSTTAKALKTAFDIPIAETVKQFKELQEKPTESLTKLAVKLGTIPIEILKQVDAYERAGNSIKAAELATKTYADAGKDAADRTVENFGIITTLGIKLGNIWNATWESIMGIGRKDTLSDQLSKAEENLKFLQTRRGADDLSSPTGRKVLATMGLIDDLKNQMTAEKDLADQRKKQSEDAAIFEADKKKRDEAAKKAASDKLKAENEYATLIENANKFYQTQVGAVENLTKSEIALNKVKESKEYKSRSADQQKEIDKIYEAAKANELVVKAEKDKADQMAVINSLMGKSSGLGKEYYDNLKQIDNALVDGNISLQEYIELLNLLYQDTPDAKKLRAENEKVVKTRNELVEAGAKQVDNAKLATQALLEESELYDYKLSLVGKEEKEVEKILKQKKIQIEYEKEIARIKSLNLLPGAKEDLELQAYEQFLLKRENLDKEANLKAMTNFQTQFDNFKSGIADSIITGLIEGGEAGSKQLRKLIEVELRKPITIIVKAAVDLLMGNSGSSSVKQAMNLYSTASSLFTVGSQVAAGTMSLANAGGTLFANATGGGIDALLATNGAYGTAAGSAGAAGSGGFAANAAAAGPYVLAAVAALNALGVFRSNKTVGGGITGTLGAGDVSTYDLNRRGGTLFSGPDYSLTNMQRSPQAIALEDAFTTIRTSTAKMAETLGLSVDKVKEFTMAVGDTKVHPDIDKLGLVLDGLSDEQKIQKIDEVLTKSSDAMAEILLGAGATSQQLVQLYNNVLQERYGLETQLLELQGDTVALRARERDQLHETNRALYDQINALKDSEIAAKNAAEATKAAADLAKSNTDDAYAALERSVNAEKTRLDSEISAVRIRENLTRESIASINNLFEILDDNIKSLYSEVNSTSNMQFNAARGLITQSLATARSTGYLPDSDQLSDAIGTVRTQLEKNQYKSKVDAERDRLLLALELQALQEITDTQLSIEEKMLEGIEDQLKSLNDQKLTLDDLLINARDQLQSSRDINTSVINLQTAITNLATAISAEAAARVEAANIAANASSASQQAASATAYAISSGSTYNASSATPVSSREQEIADIYNTVLGRSADVTGLENWVKSAMSSDEIKNAIANSAEAQARAISVEAQNQWIQQVTKEMGISTDIVARANGGYTPAGMTLVGEQGPELVNFNRPGMVYTAAQSAALMGGSSEELAAIRQELIMLRAETRAVVNNTSKAAKILDRSSPDGQSLQVTVLAA